MEGETGEIKTETGGIKISDIKEESVGGQKELTAKVSYGNEGKTVTVILAKDRGNPHQGEGLKGGHSKKYRGKHRSHTGGQFMLHGHRVK